MKKVVSLAVALLASSTLLFAVASCAPETYEIALITDIGEIDDKSFNQGTWEGVVEYATANGITHQYYKPAVQSTTAYVETIELAISKGAKVVVTPGFLFEEPIYLVQDEFPEVHFILIDGVPHSGDYTGWGTSANVQSILFAEEQAGFLAGYAAVMDGYRDLGFMGGMAVPAVVRFGLGFAVGVNTAALELGVFTTLKYHYTGGFTATPEVLAKATTWYQAGVEVIFACGGSLGQSVMAAAANEDGKVIGVDVDQHKDSDTVITSAMKGLGTGVIQALTAHYTAGEWEGGTTWNLNASNDGVGLPTAVESWGFTSFTLADYNTIYGDLAEGRVTVTVDIAVDIEAFDTELTRPRIILI